MGYMYTHEFRRSSTVVQMYACTQRCFSKFNNFVAGEHLKRAIEYYLPSSSEDSDGDGDEPPDAAPPASGVHSSTDYHQADASSARDAGVKIRSSHDSDKKRYMGLYLDFGRGSSLCGFCYLRRINKPLSAI